jgi:membrane-bound metal-dependent hydrolase YbcI (DUF457 family)
MFLGHYAVAFAVKPRARRARLWTLFLAVQWADLIWPLLLLAGVEHVRIDPGNTAVTPLDFVSYPISHSLLMDVVWGVLIGGLVYWRIRDRDAALWVGVAVVSHWVLDWITHRPDMPLWPGGPTVGLGLWNSVAATVMVESTLFMIGVALYARATRPVDRRGRWAFWGLVAFLAVVYAGNLLGPPPPSERALAWVSLSLWLLLPWAAWIERHRVTVGGGGGDGT